VPDPNLDHTLYIATLALCILLLVAIPVLLATARRRRRPEAARRWVGISVSVAVFGLAFLAGEAWMRWIYDEPQLLGPYASRNWLLRHDGDRERFRGASARAWREGRLAPEDVQVLVLGDSIVWGQGVDPHQTLPSLLQEDLGVPVLPAGKCGWSTVDQLLWLGKSRVRPRAVVLAYTFNDIQDALTDPEGAYASMQREWFDAPHRKIPLLGRSYLFDAFVYRLRELGDAGEYEAWVLASYTDEEAVARHLEQLAAMAAWSRAHGAGLVACVWPAQGPDPSPPFLEVEERFAARLREVLGAPVLLLRPALREAGIREIRDYRAGPREGHPGPEVHRVAAEQLLPYLRGTLAGAGPQDDEQEQQPHRGEEEDPGPR